jgi:hypothetical protein
MGWWKAHLNIGPRILTATCNTHESEAELVLHVTARKRIDTAETFLPVIVQVRATPAQAIATPGVVDVAPLVKTASAGCGCFMWVGASGA